MPKQMIPREVLTWMGHLTERADRTPSGRIFHWWEDEETGEVLEDEEMVEVLRRALRVALEEKCPAFPACPGPQAYVPREDR